MDRNLIEKVKNYIDEIFKERHDQRSTYHSLEHTREVAEAAEKIGKASDLNDEELEAVVIAAWFHDTGYLFNPLNHEIESVKVAEEFLRLNNYSEEKIKRITNCILATKIDQIPANILEEVIHDADYINLSNANNLKQSELLKMEAINYGGEEPTEEEWLTAELKFLLNHRYYTAYAKKKLEDKKAENIKRIKKKLRKVRENEAIILNVPLPSDIEKNKIEDMEKKEDKEEKEEKQKEEKEEKEDKKDDKKESKKEEEKKEIKKEETVSIKGFETIYRLTMANHMRLNAIADRKANIMLTLNGIVISITLTIVGSDSVTTLRAIIPASILILTCLITIIFATRATRPTITKGTISKKDIEDKKANLLFFGNFSRMEFEDFDDGIRKMMTDRDYLHNSMIQDFYNLGSVLDLKFRYLRICYNAFMYGIILSVIAIAILIVFNV